MSIIMIVTIRTPTFSVYFYGLKLYKYAVCYKTLQRAAPSRPSASNIKNCNYLTTWRVPRMKNAWHSQN